VKPVEIGESVESMKTIGLVLHATPTLRSHRSFRSPRSIRREAGAVLVMTLGILAAMVGVVAVIAANQRVAIKAQINRSQQARARLAAEAGIHRALAELQLHFDGGQTAVATLGDQWAVLGSIGSENFILGRDSFRLEIVDAAGLINLNTATQEHLERLPLTAEQIDSILDWRSGNLDPRPLGAKDEYYNNLAIPYNVKLQRFESIDELLLVKGFTPANLYEPQDDVQSTIYLGESIPAFADLITVDSSSPNTASDGQAKLNVNTANLQQMIQRGIAANVANAIIQRRNTAGTFTTLGQVLQLPVINQNNAAPVIDNLTIGGAATVQGRVNVNTAGEAVLNSLPGMQSDIASAIVARQSSGGVQALSELLSIPGMSLQVLQQNIDLLAVSTNTFLVRVIGAAGDGRVALQATVAIQNNAVRVLKIEEMPFADMWSRWGWDQEPVTEVLIAEDQ
jgi:DNA uptake protein ComE-like DNA-binding protein